jgi:hypothetical protein
MRLLGGISERASTSLVTLLFDVRLEKTGKTTSFPVRGSAKHFVLFSASRQVLDPTLQFEQIHLESWEEYIKENLRGR